MNINTETRRVVLTLAVATGLVAGVFTGGPVALAEERSTEIVTERLDSVTVGQLVEAVERTTGRSLEEPEVAAVAVDPGRALTVNEIELLLAGRDAGDVRLLATVDRPATDLTLPALDRHAGSASALQRVIKIGRIRIVVTVKCKIWPPSCTITVRW